MSSLDDVSFGNVDLIDEMYSKYMADPANVDSSWRKIFDEIDHKEFQVPAGVMPAISETSDSVRVEHLIDDYRTFGHLMAKINPIKTEQTDLPWQLSLNALGFFSDELDRQFPTNGFLPEKTASLRDIIKALQKTYCGSIGVEYMSIQDRDMRHWLQKQIEPNFFKVNLTIEQKKIILQQLNKSELFESFLHTKYVGQKRFSLEGGETLIPILAIIIENADRYGFNQLVLGMAHRGRLNVLSNILEKSYTQIFSEFEDSYVALSFEGSGDVKYHKGFSSTIKTKKGTPVEVVLAPNPSHLEAVDPIVLGQAKARQNQIPDKDREDQVIPILVHGDAAIAGQGIVYETMQFSQLKGYSTGGTIHVIVNNQIGFTTLPEDGRSTDYCSDIAKTFDAPVFHVNAEDPEGCIYATMLAVEMRQRFGCDVFIDLNCYRKYGHNEADEPAFTQPLEYQLIRSKKPIREVYRDDLIKQGVVERQMAESLEEEFKRNLQQALSQAKYPEKHVSETEASRSEKVHTHDFFEPFDTHITKEQVEELAAGFCRIPDGFNLNRKLEKLVKERQEMSTGKKPIDWGFAEALGFASVLLEGRHVRLSGQDSCRGTFSHRHALWMDQKNGDEYIPLQHLSPKQGRFDVYNSPLSEYGVLGFEYGYSLAWKEALVIWEAQFGDFANGAQLVIDQFIATGETKWSQKNSVVLFLPHGYEGQGPEHSSARIERFLSLAGNDNMCVVNPTTPAQLFHLLRRHVLKPIPKPLIVFTPKGLLRHPKCVSQIEDFTNSSFLEVLDDPRDLKSVQTLVLVSGRLYYDLLEESDKRKRDDIAFVRVEQLYPLNEEKIEAILEKYKGFDRIAWLQEEPQNMGAWGFVRPFIQKLLPIGIALDYIGRQRSASSAAGSLALHKMEYQQILDALFGKGE